MTEKSKLKKKRLIKWVSNDYFDEDRDWYVVYWEDGTTTTVHKYFDIESEVIEAVGSEIFYEAVEKTKNAMNAPIDPELIDLDNGWY